MITRQELAARAVELSVSPVFNDAVIQCEDDLTGLLLKPRFGTRVWLPKGVRPSWVAHAAEQVEQILPGQGPALVRELLLNPVRIYELAAQPPHRVLAVVGSYRRASALDPYLAVGHLHVQQKGNKVLGSGPLEIAVVPIADAVSSRSGLEQLGRSLAPREIENLKGGNSAVVIGGALDVPSPGWQWEVGAVLWSFGFRLDYVLEEPWRREPSVNRRLSERRADLYVFLRAWTLDAAGEDYTGRFAELVRGLFVVDTEEAGNLDAALAAIRRKLGEADVDTPAAYSAVTAEGATPTEAPFVPQGWDEFRDNLDRLTGDTFVITERARRECVRCGYPDPARMWEHLARLADAAAVWAAAGCAVGDSFASWIRGYNGLNVAMFDEAIVRAREDKFSYMDAKLSRLPHVQVDQAKAFTDIGRIHFALDTGHGRIVVDHIGLKLLGRGAAT